MRGADQLLREAAGSRFTAAVLRVERAGSLVIERSYGTTVAAKGAPSIAVDTRFDIASLTKLFVAAAVLAQVARGRHSLDEPLLDVLPEWKDTPHAGITLRMLLAHNSGMQSGADYRQLLGDDVERHALVRPLAAPPRERVIYSDLGFIALGVVLARGAGRSLERALFEILAGAGLQFEGASFRVPGDQQSAVPATERDPWRGLVQGFVHDEKAFLMGGVAGHAGLFASARDVAELTELFLGAACGRVRAGTIPPALLAEALAEQADDPILRRGLGWALKTSDENSCGRWFSRQTFGHTGFTGTCVWADPQRDLSVVLLTNSVHFGRTDLRDVRAGVCEAVIDDLGLR